MDPTIARVMVEGRLTELRRQAERERLGRIAAGAGDQQRADPGRAGPALRWSAG